MGDDAVAELNRAGRRLVRLSAAGLGRIAPALAGADRAGAARLPRLDWPGRAAAWLRRLPAPRRGAGDRVAPAAAAVAARAVAGHAMGGRAALRRGAASAVPRRRAGGFAALAIPAREPGEVVPRPLRLIGSGLARAARGVSPAVVPAVAPVTAPVAGALAGLARLASFAPFRALRPAAGGMPERAPAAGVAGEDATGPVPAFFGVAPVSPLARPVLPAMAPVSGAARMPLRAWRAGPDAGTVAAFGAAAEAGPAPGRAAGGAPGGPVGGDVYLDGARVGRWMARELAREAGGPQTGGAGFDARTSPVWPGALQGGVA